jgi:hypothetical protein
MVIVIVSMCRDGGGNSGHGDVVVSTGEDYNKHPPALSQEHRRVRIFVSHFRA